MRWSFYNKVDTVLILTVDLLVKNWQVQDKKGRDRDIGENEEKGSEGAVQETNFNYFPGPQTKDLDLFMWWPFK